MDNQNLIMKTGFVSKRKGGFFFFVVLVLIFSLVFQSSAFALGRSHAGGGKLASFSVGKWAMGTAIGLASFAIGGYVGNAINPSPGYSGIGSITTWANNYSVMIAVNQTGRAMGMAGQYYGWDPKATLFASSIVSSMVGGGLNPGQFGVSGAFNGIAMGGIYGTIDGAILAGIANDKGQVPPWASPVAGLAAGFGTGFISGGLTNSSDVFSFGNKFDFTNAFGVAMYKTTSGLPGAGIGVGLGYATQGMDRQDAYIINQAASGLYPIGGAIGSKLGNGVLTDLGYKKIHVVPSPDNYSNFNSNSSSSNLSINRGVFRVDTTNSNTSVLSK